VIKKKSIALEAGFTIIELFIVFLLIGITAAILVIRTGSYSYWRQEGFIRQLSDTIIFLHYQAVSDQAFYRMEFNIKDNIYTVGVVRPEYDESGGLNPDDDAGNLTLELSAILSPSVGSSTTLIPPPSFPSLAKPVSFPPELKITDIRTPRGKQNETDEDKPYIYFSPRGFSEFSVIHLMTGEEQPVTILVNPFSGNTTIYREYKDFEWTYGRDKKTT
jgi:type II secretory pathway pseudopilin PulG